ncbi:unnamed protein product [Durusdinium trenchii]|uniref:Uncharacterized protein n=1 Tax=Durusdinium trenchii TaxID=1381693 RepID=A0ABP0SV56_9DINO
MDKQGVTRSVCGVESVPPAFYSIVSLTRLRRGPGDLQAQFLPPPRLRGPVGSMAPLGYQPGRLMAHLVTSFVEPGKAEGAGMAMKPDPVADSLPLDIHVIIKKASGGIGGVQVTKPSAVGGLNPEVAAVAAGAPKAAKAAMCTLAPRYVLPQHGGRRRPNVSLAQFL